MWLLILFSVYSRPQGTAECLLYGYDTHRHPHGGPAHTHHLYRDHCECKCDAWHCEVHSAHDSTRYDLVYDGASTHTSLPHHTIALGVASLLSQCSADDALRGGWQHMPTRTMLCPIAMAPPCGFSSYPVCTAGPRAPPNASYVTVVPIDTHMVAPSTPITCTGTTVSASAMHGTAKCTQLMIAVAIIYCTMAQAPTTVCLIIISHWE